MISTKDTLSLRSERVGIDQNDATLLVLNVTHVCKTGKKSLRKQEIEIESY
jgi:hypothetical protein